mmetsp:Transcript_7814/g.26222  ORF Transcript_7814/g.26222 Transcript_7814/m.26222 type:complete len:228 (-) Transcript_7814:927-1610(-)
MIASAAPTATLTATPILKTELRLLCRRYRFARAALGLWATKTFDQSRSDSQCAGSSPRSQTLCSYPHATPAAVSTARETHHSSLASPRSIPSATRAPHARKMSSSRDRRRRAQSNPTPASPRVHSRSYALIDPARAQCVHVPHRHSSAIVVRNPRSECARTRAEVRRRRFELVGRTSSAKAPSPRSVSARAKRPCAASGYPWAISASWCRRTSNEVRRCLTPDVPEN